jgi:hypothetical protein
MKRALIPLVTLLVALAGCIHGPYEPDFTPPSAPTGLRTATGDNFIELFWNANREPDVSGYNVYVSSAYNGRYERIGSSSRPYFNDNGAVNGTTYYYAVTAYDYDGNESALSKDVAYDIPRPEGYNRVLTDYRTAPATAGYDFSGYAVVAYNDQTSDIWYENYNGVSYMDVRTDTDIQDMGPTASILDISSAPSSGWSTTHDVALAVGHTYVVWTYDDHYAKFRVAAMSSGRVTIDWAYQLQKSNPLLKRAVGADALSRPAATPHRVN